MDHIRKCDSSFQPRFHFSEFSHMAFTLLCSLAVCSSKIRNSFDKLASFCIKRMCLHTCTHTYYNMVEAVCNLIHKQWSTVLAVKVA